MRNIFGGMKIKRIIRKLVLPFLRIVVIIGVVLFMIEQVIRILLIPITWILFGISVDEYYEESFILWFGENVFDPFCKKIGITDLYY